MSHPFLGSNGDCDGDLTCSYFGRVGHSRWARSQGRSNGGRLHLDYQRTVDKKSQAFASSAAHQELQAVHRAALVSDEVWGGGGGEREGRVEIGGGVEEGEREWRRWEGGGRGGGKGVEEVGGGCSEDMESWKWGEGGCNGTLV